MVFLDGTAEDEWDFEPKLAQSDFLIMPSEYRFGLIRIRMTANDR